MIGILEVALWGTALGQVCVALLNLNLVRILGWKSELEAMPLLVREVFKIHTWFISLTLLIFAVLTWRFGPVMARGDDEVARWLAAAIGIFWGIRAVLQVAHYSASHWRGNGARSVVHFFLLTVYAAWAVLYAGVGIGFL
jgi:hypothetical protein